MEDASPNGEEAALLVQTLTREEAARQAALEVHLAAHVGFDTLWKLFWDRFSYNEGTWICLEVAQSCIQCQAGTDYGETLKTAGTMKSMGPWDTLLIDIVVPVPANQRMEYLITFLDCYSKYTILIPSKDHTTQTVNNALLNRVISFFGVPWRLLSDQGQEFTGRAWEELLKALGVQRVLNSPYHTEDNDINKQSHCTVNNMLRAYLYCEKTPVPRRVNKITAIMLTLNSMPRQPHGYSTSMIAKVEKTLYHPTWSLEQTLPKVRKTPLCTSAESLRNLGKSISEWHLQRHLLAGISISLSISFGSPLLS